MEKQLLPQEDVLKINVCTPKNRASKYLKQKLTVLKKEIDNSTTRVEDFNVPLSKVDRITAQKISKDTEELNSLITNMTQLTFTEHLTKQQINTHFFQVYVEHSPG